ncbi:hypothetical protein LPJ66_001050 [Kickxella alabastrina]|uniref:Uncharacterized protein n=1 Tax=Kickxella alabastrina TaxID=61397 RepID=A0ACC1IUM2_9FUNG|nr:hypothetical protein LPJ66_001050 [Kickxella alabastrina]
MVCSICFGSLFEAQGGGGDIEIGDRPATLLCGHVYHKDCIECWLSHTSTKVCPLCKTWPKDIALPLFVDLDEDDITCVFPESSPKNRQKCGFETVYGERGANNPLVLEMDKLTVEFRRAANDNIEMGEEAQMMAVQQISMITLEMENQSRKLQETTRKIELLMRRTDQLNASLEEKRLLVEDLELDLEIKSEYIADLKIRTCTDAKINTDRVDFLFFEESGFGAD